LGVVKSMVVDPFLPEEILSHRLLRRPVPLLDQKILIITGKGKNKEESKVNSHLYVTYNSETIISFSMRWDPTKLSDVPYWQRLINISRNAGIPWSLRMKLILNVGIMQILKYGLLSLLFRLRFWGVFLMSFESVRMVIGLIPDFENLFGAFLRGF
jgi:hypothetical protein